MKKYITLIAFIAVLVGCDTPKKDKGITFDKVAIESEKECDGVTCPEIDITYPQLITTTFPVEKINKHIEQAVVAIINSSPDEEVTTMSVDKAIENFKAEFEQTKKDFPDFNGGYEAKVDGSVTYESEKLICLKLNSFMFTGGAHGYAATRYINIDAVKGTVISNADLFKDEAKFKAIAEKAFRTHEKIAEDVSMKDSGYWFKNDVYQLPEAIGFTDTDVVLFYNPYDISPYSEGPIEINIPIEQVKDNLVFL